MYRTDGVKSFLWVSSNRDSTPWPFNAKWKRLQKRKMEIGNPRINWPGKLFGSSISLSNSRDPCQSLYLRMQPCYMYDKFFAWSNSVKNILSARYSALLSQGVCISLIMSNAEVPALHQIHCTINGWMNLFCLIFLF